MRPEPRLALLGDSATPNLEGFGGVGGWFTGVGATLCALFAVS